MYTENMVRIVAGVLVVIGVTLGRFWSEWWLLLPLFVGVNLVQSVFSGFCLAATIFRKLGVKDKCPEAADVSGTAQPQAQG